MRAQAGRFLRFQRDEPRIVDALELTGTEPDRMRMIMPCTATAVRDLDDEWSERQPRLLRRLFHRVTLHPGPIHIALNRSGLGRLVRLCTVANTYRERGVAENGMGEGFQSVLNEYRPTYKECLEVDSPAEMTTEIKGLARLFGADLVGIAEYDERWVYTKAYSTRHQEERPNEDFRGMRHVIVLGHAMDYELLKTYPSATASAAVGHGYSSEAGTGIQLSQYIRGLGYRASASMNDTELVVPYAIKAGLGEFGRHNMVITPEFGPRVRFSKIFTDLPLVNDAPIRLGAKEFCDICDRCTSACPPRAISPDAPTAEIPNRSNLTGVRKWQLDAEKCFKYWTNINSECGICIRVCPFNKDFSRPVMRIARWLAGTPLRRLMLKLDIWLGYGRRVAPKTWWGLIRSK